MSSPYRFCTRQVEVSLLISTQSEQHPRPRVERVRKHPRAVSIERTSDAYVGHQPLGTEPERECWVGVERQADRVLGKRQSLGFVTDAERFEGLAQRIRAVAGPFPPQVAPDPAVAANTEQRQARIPPAGRDVVLDLSLP